MLQSEVHMHRLHALLAVAVTVLATTMPVTPAVAISLEGSDPIGSLEVAESPNPGVVVVTGWAVDPDTAAPVDIRVDVVGAPGSPPMQFTLGPARIDRPEVGATYDGVGDEHGFEARLELPPDTVATSVYVYALNSPGTPGADQMIGSVPIDIQPDAIGSLEAITATPDGYVRIRGWTADPLSGGSLLTVWLGSKFVWSSGSGIYHPLPALLGYGGDRGFDALVGGDPYFTPGAQRICVHIGFRVGLGCRTVTIVEDHFAPETTLTRVPPPSGSDTSAVLAFSSTEPGTFTCRWGLGDWSGCNSPVVATVAPGSHTFSVRASDGWGNTDETPATVTFTVTRPRSERLDVRAEAVRHASQLLVDVDPDSLGWNYRFRVLRRVDDAWRTVCRRSTRGPRDIRVLDLDRGRYRVVVPAQHGMRRDVARVRLLR